MKTDIEIAREVELEDISLIAERLGLSTEEYALYGKHKAKISLDVLKKSQQNNQSKLILMTAVNPTPGGEGKTTANIGLSMALNRLGKKAISALREPSQGPVFGMKGGATGGGYSQVLPMEDINLHFTGDIHAITSAHNLLAAILDNHIYQGNELNINPKKINWKRVLDVNDRALRNVVIGLGPNADGVTRESQFDITVASEIMAILCLAEDFADLRARLARMELAYTYDNEIISSEDLGATDALAILLKDAIKPNLVQTSENTPAIIHGGPFANIAHGANSIIGTKTAMKLADYVVTEAGFGADLGAEKFFDIVTRQSGLEVDAVVLVATVRALKYNGGSSQAGFGHVDLDALDKGFVNLKQHAENLRKFNVPVIVAINKFPDDSQAEIELLSSKLDELGFEWSLTDVHALGSEGALDLADKVITACETESEMQLLYDDNLGLVDKIKTIAREIYRADGVEFAVGARSKLRRYEREGYGNFSICVAKTQYSFSDDVRKLAAPRNFKIHVRDVQIKKGAGFIVILAGNIMTMPGLPKNPAALGMSIDEAGNILGLS